MPIARLGRNLIRAARTLQWVVLLLVFGGQRAVVHIHHHLHTSRCHTQDVHVLAHVQSAGDCGLCTLAVPIESQGGAGWAPCSYPPRSRLEVLESSFALAVRVVLPPARGPPLFV